MEKNEEIVYNIIAGMQCLRNLENWNIGTTHDGKVATVTTTFGRNGHGRQSDYLFTIAKTVERLEMSGFDAEITYTFDNLDDVGHIDWRIHLN